MTYIRNNKTLVFIIAILLLSNIALLYSFVTKGGKNDHPESEKSTSARKYMIETLTNEVGFNQEQIAQYEQMSDKHKQIIKPLFQEIKLTKDSLYKMLEEAAVSDSTVNYYLNMIGEKQKSIDQKIFYHFLSLREICTAEQRSKFDTVVQRIVKNMINSSSKKSGKDKK